jgi:curved DNA-binding protein CbpA
VATTALVLTLPGTALGGLVRVTYNIFCDYYVMLGLQADASFDEIKRAIRAQLLQHHPDHHAGQPSERARQLIEARAVLLVPADRKDYDEQRHATMNAIVRLMAAGAAPKPMSRGARWNLRKKRAVRRAQARKSAGRGSRFA